MTEVDSEVQVVTTKDAVKILKEPPRAEVAKGRKTRKLIPDQERRRVRDLDEDVLADVRGKCRDYLFHFQGRLAETQDPTEKEELQQAIDIFTVVSSLSPQEKDPNAILLTCAAGTLLKGMLEQEQEEAQQVISKSKTVREKAAEVLEAKAKAQQLKSLAELTEEEAEKDPSLRQRAADLRNQAEEAEREIREKVRLARILEIEEATDNAVEIGQKIPQLEEALLNAEKDAEKAAGKETKATERLKQAERELDRLLPPQLKNLEQKRRELENEAVQLEEQAKKAEEEAKLKADYLQSSEYQRKLSEAQDKIDDAQRKEALLKKNLDEIEAETNTLKTQLEQLKQKGRLSREEFRRKSYLERETTSKERTERTARAREAHSAAEQARISAEREKTRIEQEAQKAREEAEKKAQEARNMADEKKKEANRAKKQISAALRRAPNRQDIEDKRNELEQKEQALDRARKEREEKETTRQKAKEALEKAKAELIEAQSLVKQLQAAERRRRMQEDDLEVLGQEIESLKETLMENRSKFERLLDRVFGRTGIEELIKSRNLATEIMINEILQNPSAFLEAELDLKAERKGIVAGTEGEGGEKKEEESPIAEAEIGKAEEGIKNLTPEQRQELESDFQETDEEKKKKIMEKWAGRLGVSLGIIALIFALIGELAKLEKRGG